MNINGNQALANLIASYENSATQGAGRKKRQKKSSGSLVNQCAGLSIAPPSAAAKGTRRRKKTVTQQGTLSGGGAAVQNRPKLHLRCALLGARDATIPQWMSLSYFVQDGLVPPPGSVSSDEQVAPPSVVSSDKYTSARQMSRNTLLSLVAPELRTKFTSGNQGDNVAAYRDHFAKFNHTLAKYVGQKYHLAVWNESLETVNIHVYCVIHMPSPPQEFVYDFPHYRLVMTALPQINGVVKKQDWIKWIASTLGL